MFARKFMYYCLRWRSQITSHQQLFIRCTGEHNPLWLLLIFQQCVQTCAWHFTRLLNNQIYTLSPSLVEICRKMTKLCCFSQDNPPSSVWAVNALQLCGWKFHTKKLCSRLSSRKAQFLIRKMVSAILKAPSGGLGATYAVHRRLIGKLVVNFLLVIIELFFARCFHFVTIHAFDRRTDGLLALYRACIAAARWKLYIMSSVHHYSFTVLHRLNVTR